MFASSLGGLVCCLVVSVTCPGGRCATFLVFVSCLGRQRSLFPFQKERSICLLSRRRNVLPSCVCLLSRKNDVLPSCVSYLGGLRLRLLSGRNEMFASSLGSVVCCLLVFVSYPGGVMCCFLVFDSYPGAVMSLHPILEE